MADLAAYLACVIGIAGTWYRLAWSRGRPPSPGLRYICGIGLCFGAAMAFLAPASVEALGRISPMPNLASLAGDELKMAAACFIALTAWWVHAPERRLVRRRYAWATAGVLLVEALLFAGSDTGSTGDTMRPSGGARWLFVGYDVIFLGYVTVSLLTFIWLVGQHVRRLPPGPIKAGLRLGVLSAVVALVWAGWLIEDINSLVRHGIQDSDEDTQSAVFAMVCIVLTVMGASVTLWRPHVLRAGRWLRAVSAYHRIGPLWTALYAAFPEIAMTPRPHWLARLLPRDAEFELYRRIIEIHDAQLALRPYHPRRLPIHPNAAVAEATTVAAALASVHTGARAQSPAPRTPTEVQPTLDAEAAWLTQVSRAFVRMSRPHVAMSRLSTRMTRLPARMAGFHARMSRLRVAMVRLRVAMSPVRVTMGRPAGAPVRARRPR